MLHLKINKDNIAINTTNIKTIRNKKGIVRDSERVEAKFIGLYLDFCSNIKIINWTSLKRMQVQISQGTYHLLFSICIVLMVL